jgi:hypothetical protein
MRERRLGFRPARSILPRQRTRLASNALLCRNQIALKRFRVGGCCHRIS